MIVKEKYTQTYTGERVKQVFCDICKREAPSPVFERALWTGSSSYDIDEVILEYREGENYPEGGDTDVTNYDICPTCFKEKIVPFLASLGATPRKSRVNW